MTTTFPHWGNCNRCGKRTDLCKELLCRVCSALEHPEPRSNETGPVNKTEPRLQSPLPQNLNKLKKT
jgi:hypothetical protein